jgi:hypothetical protein
LPDEIRDGAQGIQVLALKEPQSISIGNPLTRGDLFIKVLQLAPLDEKVHEIGLSEGWFLANCSLTGARAKLACCA